MSVERAFTPMGLQHAMGERVHVEALLDTGNQHAVGQGHIIVVVGWSAAHDRGVDAGFVEPEALLERVQVKGRGGTVLMPGIRLLEEARSRLIVDDERKAILFLRLINSSANLQPGVPEVPGRSAFGSSLY